jgi:hypothetical protein
MSPLTTVDVNTVLLPQIAFQTNTEIPAQINAEAALLDKLITQLPKDVRHQQQTLIVVVTQNITLNLLDVLDALMVKPVTMSIRDVKL